MNLTFSYILAGWEGSIHNNKILKNALFTRDFKISKEKYYLVDIRY